MKNVFKCLALISQLGISMMVPVILCTIIGVYVDSKFSIPITIPMIAVGILAGLRNVYAIIKQTTKDIVGDSEKDEEE